jgi:hypothetical protein
MNTLQFLNEKSSFFEKLLLSNKLSGEYDINMESKFEPLKVLNVFSVNEQYYFDGQF